MTTEETPAAVPETPATKQCPFCAETIQAQAIVCRYCGRDLAPAAPAPPVATAVARDGLYVCSVCGGYVRPDAKQCKHCKVMFGQVVPEGFALPQPKAPPKRLHPFAIIGIIVGVLALMSAAIVLAGRPAGSAAPSANAQVVTMDGSDPATGTTIDPINLFDHLPGGRKVGTVQSGTRVILVRREGAVALIQTPDGVQGYVAADFIKEFR